MNQIEENRRGNMISAMRRFQKVILPLITDHMHKKYKDSDKDNLCNRCGRPTFANTCAFCRMLDSLHGRFNRVETDLKIDLRKKDS